MKKYILMLTTSAFILACGGIAASAQENHSTSTPGEQHAQHHQEGSGMAGQGGMMGRGMMGQGMMGHGRMGGALAMRIIFALMDSDGDGTISLQEFQTAHERIFKATDANKDGVLTPEEIRAFMRGTGNPAVQREHEHAQEQEEDD